MVGVEEVSAACLKRQLTWTGTADCICLWFITVYRHVYSGMTVIPTLEEVRAFVSRLGRRHDYTKIDQVWITAVDTLPVKVTPGGR